MDDRGQAPPHDPSGADRADTLTPARIVAAAIVVADADGLEGLSLRRVATDLGVSPAALGRHVTGRQDLVTRMTDAVLWAQWRPPAQPPPGWRAQLELAGRMLWTAYRRHPWLAPALSRTRPQPITGGVAYTEWVLTALDGHGLSPTEAFDVHLTLFNLVRGTAINVDAGPVGREERAAVPAGVSRSVVASGRYPHVERLLAAEADDGADFSADSSADTVFERGLRYLLDGLAVALDTAGGVPPEA